MKTKIIAFITLLTVLMFYVNSCAMVLDELHNSPSSVYVTKTGKCYHCSSCRTISKSKHLKEMSITQAELKGYKRCGICKP